MKAFLIVLATLFTFGAQAAHISISANANTGDVTIGMGQFEFGSFANGIFLQSGLGSGSQTFPAAGAPVTFDGRWIAPAANSSASYLVEYVYAGTSDLAAVLDLNLSVAGSIGTAVGSIVTDYNDALGAAGLGGATHTFYVDATGTTFGFSAAFLTGNATVSGVPAPATFALLGLGCALLGLRRAKS